MKVFLIYHQLNASAVIKFTLPVCSGRKMAYDNKIAYSQVPNKFLSNQFFSVTTIYYIFCKHFCSMVG